MSDQSVQTKVLILSISIFLGENLGASAGTKRATLQALDIMLIGALRSHHKRNYTNLTKENRETILAHYDDLREEVKIGIGKLSSENFIIRN